jgi:GT2 family glycosyltransferase
VAIFIAVISHNHTRDIIDGLKPERINAEKDVTVVIKGNKHCPELENHCKSNSIDYLVNTVQQGFGHNNNDVFLYCRLKHNMKNDDLFVVLNPDVVVEPDIFKKLDLIMRKHNVRLAAPNLFKDEQLKILECSIRKFPLPWDFITSFFLKSRKTTVERDHINQPVTVDWASGAFLAFRASLYKKLSGFSPKYYLYCEDIDICWRAKVLFNEPTWYIPNIKAVHKGHRHSHSLFSKYIRWHIGSAYQFSKRYMAWQIFGIKPKI